MRLKIGVLGGGRMGRVHVRTLSALSSVKVSVWVCGSQATKEILQLDFPHLLEQGCRFLAITDSDELFKEKLDGIIVASPSQEHEAQIRDALTHGAGVFCEKPLARDIKESENLFKLAEEKHLPLFCAFQRRFDPSFREAVEKSRTSLGKLHMIKSCSRDPASGFQPSKSQYSIFFDSTIHDIDMCCWVVGEKPEWVFSTVEAQDSRVKEFGDWDTVAVTLKFPSGAIGLIDQSRYSAYGYDQRLEIYGAEGMVEVKNETAHTVQHFAHNCCVSANPFGYFTQRYAKAYQLEMEHFIKIMQGLEENILPGSEVITGLRAAEAAEKSARTGLPVKIE